MPFLCHFPRDVWEAVYAYREACARGALAPERRRLLLAAGRMLIEVADEEDRLCAEHTARGGEWRGL